jgi:hypothetical protein
MLPDLLQVHQRILQSFADCRHATESSSLELLTLEQALAILDQAHVVPRHGFDQRFCRVQLTESDSKVVGIVEGVEQISVERMDVLEAWEGFDGAGEALGKRLGCVLDFTGAAVLSDESLCSAYHDTH